MRFADISLDIAKVSALMSSSEIYKPIFAFGNKEDKKEYSF